MLGLIYISYLVSVQEDRLSVGDLIMYQILFRIYYALSSLSDTIK